VAAAGARAVAGSSWAVAAAQGYGDGEKLPLELLVTIHARIVAATDLPVSADCESGYAIEPEAVAANVARLIEAGVVGINFEDQRVREGGMFAVGEQCDRIRAVRQRAAAVGVPLFVNARTDLFLQAPDASAHRELLPAAKERAAAYREAGASGLFVPGLVDEELLADLCASVALPVNVMMVERAPAISRLAELGVARVSFGSMAFDVSASALEERARRIFQA
jgi:2-methylisocitrate lyase-like PEP mutase family enzyme